ncbi:protein phosphatase methylesterase 1 [Trichinella spiralis]|uniref:protein phosphatase methylesterase 1 n=1 Tax=Trichinella spiralis TaxID=6334 RepID=UPI0001EFCA65|nr:protein phosphatase methylesterase 1 [Trichinella spiralis]
MTDCSAKQETTAVIVGIMREKRRTSGIRDRMIELKIKGETSEKPRFQILCICSVYISCLSDDKISFLHSIKQSIITANRFKRESVSQFCHVTTCKIWSLSQA